MKAKLCMGIIGLFFTLPAWADLNLEPLLNKVTVQFTANQWVTTQTALVNVSINAAVTDQAIEQMQNNILQKLNQLVKGEWHVISFNRSQDNSGLEKVTVIAQARLAQNDLANLRNKAKEISKPGETYTIDSVQFTPSEDEFRAANIQLRENIYQQVKTEIDSLNKIYPDQKFYVHQIDFGMQAIPLAHQSYMMKENMAAAAAPMPRQAMDVGNKTELQATAVIASLPIQIPQQLPR